MPAADGDDRAGQLTIALDGLERAVARLEGLASAGSADRLGKVVVGCRRVIAILRSIDAGDPGEFPRLRDAGEQLARLIFILECHATPRPPLH